MNREEAKNISKWPGTGDALGTQVERKMHNYKAELVRKEANYIEPCFGETVDHNRR